MADIFAGSLDDPRVNILEGDVFDVIRSSPRTFDAILLDVDNGPEGLTRKANDALYDFSRIESGLGGAAAARCPGGLVFRTQSAICKTPAPRRI